MSRQDVQDKYASANSYRIPDEAVKYILLQRTEYFTLAHNILIRIFKNFLSIFNIDLDYDRLAEFEARFRREKIKLMYMSAMESEYLRISAFLPKKCCNIIDIGCGVSGIDVFINDHYPNNNVEFYLLDKSIIEEDIHYMFERRGSFYDSLEIAKKILMMNGVKDEHIHLVEATIDNKIEINERLDLALSTISWGFHYPIEVYLDRVYELLNDDGVLIVDIRKATDGLERIAGKFGGYRTVFEDEKFVRICATKRPAA